MKKLIIITSLIVTSLCLLAWYAEAYRPGHTAVSAETVSEAVEPYDEWDTLIQALIQVESEGDPRAVNPTGAAGVLQITPVYVEDANRISGAGTFSQDDRFDTLKSVEMFTVVQRHYNPRHDIDKAIRLHNPKAGKWYLLQGEKRDVRYSEETFSN